MSELTYVALGSNVGDRSAYLSAARAALSLLPGVMLLAASRVEETAPFGDAAQGPYLNQMVVVRSTLEPEALLQALLRIEQRLGRVRGARWGPRTIDLDIVAIGMRRFSSPTLTLPHPGLANRDFWHRELSELEQSLAAAA